MVGHTAETYWLLDLHRSGSGQRGGRCDGGGGEGNKAAERWMEKGVTK